MEGVKFDESNGGFVPKPKLSQPAKRSKKDKELADRNLAVEAFTNLNRTALGVVADNGTASSFKTECARLLLARANIGNKHHSQEYYNELVFIAARLKQREDTNALLRTELPSLGGPGFFQISFDTFPIGGISAFGRHGSAMVIAAKAASPLTGRLHYRIIIRRLLERCAAEAVGSRTRSA